MAFNNLYNNDISRLAIIVATSEAFAGLLSTHNLRADQMTFINQIMAYLEKNGNIDPGMLFESPFTDMNDQGLLAVFEDAQASRVISIVERINGNAVA